jgi:hypothetical protein
MPEFPWSQEVLEQHLMKKGCQKTDFKWRDSTHWRCAQDGILVTVPNAPPNGSAWTAAQVVDILHRMGCARTEH